MFSHPGSSVTECTKKMTTPDNPKVPKSGNSASPCFSSRSFVEFVFIFDCLSKLVEPIGSCCLESINTSNSDFSKTFRICSLWVLRRRQAALISGASGKNGTEMSKIVEASWRRGRHGRRRAARAAVQRRGP